MRYELSDSEWRTIREMLPSKPRGVPRVDDRRVLNGIFWVLRSGAPWRDLPDSYGPRTTCYNRFVRWRRAGIWETILNALATAHDAAVQMIDTSMVRVHQHAACIADSANHDNRLCSALLKGIGPRTMVLADRDYDADWIRALVSEQGAWANIPPKRNRKDPICFSPHLYRARNRIERFFNTIKHCRRVATRYDKLAANYLGFVQLACIRLWLRVYEFTP
jgi:transposase